MRAIDADKLMPKFIEKAFTLQDRHGVKLGENWLLDYNDIQEVIDNEPTLIVGPKRMGYIHSNGNIDWFDEGAEVMTDQEQNMVNRMKIAIARMILDIDDDLILDAIKKVLSEKEKGND